MGSESTATLAKTHNPGAKSGLHIGIDVGGRPSKGFDLCALTWAGGVPTKVAFSSVPHGAVLPNTDTLRPVVEKNDVAHFAKLTHQSALTTSLAVWKAITLFGDPCGVYVDSPSGFSRNTTGHGRRTEKAALPGVSFQMTPSLHAGKSHQGDWGWLVYGMVAFAATIHRDKGFTVDEWEEHIRDGLYQPTLRLQDLTVRECFPTASIVALRAGGRAGVISLIGPVKSQAVAVVTAVEAYLINGVRGTKRSGKALYDRADAFVAALTGLPDAAIGYSARELLPVSQVKWAGRKPADHVLEGAITLPT